MKKDSSRSVNHALISSLTYAAVTLSIFLVMLGLTYVISFMSLFMIVLVPFLTTLFVAKADYKAQLIFASCLILICFVDIQEGFLTMLPNALIGIVYGNLYKRYGVSFITFFLSLIGTYLIELFMLIPTKLIYSISAYDIYSLILNLDEASFNLYFLTFFFFLTLIQLTFTSFMINEDIKKLNLKLKEIKTSDLFDLVLVVSLATLLVILGHFLYAPLTYLSLSLLVIITVYELVKNGGFSAKKIKFIYVITAVFLLSFISFIISFISLEKNLKYIAFFILIIPNTIEALIMIIYIKIKKPSSIKEEGLDLLDLVGK